MADKGVALDKASVLRVAELANLRLSIEEVDYYQAQLARIIDYVDALAEISPLRGDTVEFVSSYKSEPRERSDLLSKSLDPHVALANAAKTSDTTFQVPRLID